MENAAYNQLFPYSDTVHMILTTSVKTMALLSNNSKMNLKLT